MNAPISPVDRHALRTRVSAELTAFLDRQETLLSAVSADLLPAVAALRDFLDGGKRMRPAFCYWGWRAAGGADSASGSASDADEPAAVRAAASLELLQASALIHDDYMDGSDTRRGAPAIHRRFEALHRAGGWEGGAERFGAAAAILLGDITLTWCDEMFTRCGLDAVRIHAARPVFDLMRSEVMAGQYLDVVAQARGLSVSTPAEALARARTIIRYKSAKYTVERPLQLGAALATGLTDGPLIDALSRYGLPLGEAFQLRDDVLGVFGDPAATGKPAGDDLREGKQTVLVALAAERATEAQSKALRSGLGDPALDEEGVAALRSVIAETGALADVERSITELTDTALGALAAAPVTAEAREVLTELAYAATTRQV
ncbi:MAG TPA: polyprenyl synthetase family protein [Actinocrinis sp.]|uniref:polyprenyl synthetase family protein n=1 Tax=Actinocrinis sp. TaxID=1920516 RepID=UPI002DDD569C|nr:polyprenyl synthetase family protein [Actinocrinis sp.]HEV3172474.1 polyprenyl synthetase family protein [Actinocrinis sp.]